jgi:hypothetical protein
MLSDMSALSRSKKNSVKKTMKSWNAMPGSDNTKAAALFAKKDVTSENICMKLCLKGWFCMIELREE